MTAMTIVSTAARNRRIAVTVGLVVAAHAAVLALLATMKPIEFKRIEPPKPIEVKFVQLAPPPPPPPPPKPKPEPKPKEVKVVQAVPKPQPKPQPAPVIKTEAVSAKPQAEVQDRTPSQPVKHDEPPVKHVEVTDNTPAPEKTKTLPSIDGIYFVKQPNFDFDNDEDLLGKSRNIMLKFTVGVDGKPKDITVVQTTGLPALDKKVKAALAKATLKPRKVDGVAVEAIATVPFVLNLNNE